MASFNTYLFIYVVGGLTFLPLCVACLFFVLYLSFPTIPIPQDDSSPKAKSRNAASFGSHESGETRETKSRSREINAGSDNHEGDREDHDEEGSDSSIRSVDVKLAAQDSADVAAAGYFSVCREYVPGGVNAKPPEKSSPTGEISYTAHTSNGAGGHGGDRDKDRDSGSFTGSGNGNGNGNGNGGTSVYQSMYRSLFSFEGRKQQSNSSASLNRDISSSTSLSSSNGGNGGSGTSGNGKGSKKKNLFYVVLRHGHLMLYDDVEQIEVRHVISLAHHNVSVYSGGEAIPEGELWIKRNAICLTRKPETTSEVLESPSSTMPFYFFSDRLSEKEDFYFAILRSLGSISDDSTGTRQSPRPLRFDPDHIVSLTHRIHSSKEHLEASWLNAFIGRWFLSVYQTPEFLSTIRKKIEKKIARMPKLPLLTDIVLKSIDPGDGAPMITNPRLVNLNPDGTTCIELDLTYEGGFMIRIASSARFEFGPRIKAKEVPINLWVGLKKLSGHCLLRFKPPPSNRIWYAFTAVPQMDMTIRPVLGEKHVNINIAIRAIETKIREALAESVVLPFWDDIPFYNTENKEIRGGIWEYKEKPKPKKQAAPPPRRSSCSDAPVLDTKRESVGEKSFFDASDASDAAENSSNETHAAMRKSATELPLESEKSHGIIDHPHTFPAPQETSDVAVDTAEVGGIFTSSAPTEEKRRRSSHTSHLSSNHSLSEFSEKPIPPQHRGLSRSASKATLQNIFNEASNAISAKRRTVSSSNNDEKRRESIDSIRSTTADSMSSDRTMSSQKSNGGSVMEGISVAKRWGMNVFGRKNRKSEQSASSIQEDPQQDVPGRKQSGSAASEPGQASTPPLIDCTDDEMPSPASRAQHPGKVLSAPAPISDKFSPIADEVASTRKSVPSLLSVPTTPRPKSTPVRKHVPPPFVPALPPRSKTAHSDTDIDPSISEQPQKEHSLPPPLPAHIPPPRRPQPPLPARPLLRYMSSETDSTFTTSRANSEVDTSLLPEIRSETASPSSSPFPLASTSDSSLLVIATHDDEGQSWKKDDETSGPDREDDLTPRPRSPTVIDNDQDAKSEVNDTEIATATVEDPGAGEKKHDTGERKGEEDKGEGEVRIEEPIST